MANSFFNRRGGAFPIFKIAGIQVSLHWTWLLVAYYELGRPQGEPRYSQPIWNVIEYLSLFVIVLMHEFGHALACRSVGGEANQIVLWPLGGVAFVRPPPRPGAWLWSIVAGPLVNVALIPVTIGLMYAAHFIQISRDAETFIRSLATINIILLIFNMLPIYPLDGGKIVQSLLWFVIGQAKSLLVASVIGMVAAGAGIVLLLVKTDPSKTIWLLLIAGFAIYQSFLGFKSARAMSKVLALPRVDGFACPACKQAPPAAAFWRCQCGNRLNPFLTGGRCPNCGNAIGAARCVLCGSAAPLNAWISGPAAALRTPRIPTAPIPEPGT
jgi:Zn-dependent protease